MSRPQTKPATQLQAAASSLRFALMVLCLGAWSPTALTASEPTARYLVVLEGEPAAAAYLRAQSEKASITPVNAAARRVTEIAAQQDALSPQIRALGAIEIGRLQKLVNVVVVDATTEQAAAIQSLPGVLQVRRSRAYELNTAASVPFIGAPAVWAGTPAADGSGMRIGIIDTGIDYTHADFG